MTYLALYRQWRPRSFSEVAGQAHITRTLQNALKAGRISHAYLFTGPRGTGKTTVARILARAVNCETGPSPEPCNECAPCRSSLAGSSPDVVEIDAASHRGIDEMRDLRERVRFAPAASRYRVYVVDEVHMLTPEAFNALLKTLEEPPSHAIFVLATTEPHKIPLTVMSRCQRFDFRRLAENEIRDVLTTVAAAEEAEVQPGAVAAIARRAEGSLRDALGVLDQCLAYAGSRVDVEQVHEVLGTVQQDILDRMAGCLRQGTIVPLLELLDEVVAAGKDIRQLTRDLTEHLRGRLVAALAGSGEGWALGELLSALEGLAQAEADMRWSPQPRLVLEMALFRLTGCRAATGGSVEAGEPLGPPQPATPEPEATAAPGPAAATPADLDRLWPQVLRAVEARSVPLRSFLQSGRPVGSAEGTVTLGFPFSSEVQMRRIATRGKKILTEALREVTGQDWDIRFNLVEESPPQCAGSGGTLEKQVVDLFGGVVVEDEEAGRG
ncbi:MAG: DNA polymerase III subunit gamma/tau [bacterium]|nr:DNA polymerase III subunit gamma/tau [bacterium]